MSHQLTSDIEAGGKKASQAIKKIREAINDCDGNVSATARELGVSRWTVIRWFSVYPELDAYAKKLREDRGTMASVMANARESRWQAR